MGASAFVTSTLSGSLPTISRVTVSKLPLRAFVMLRIEPCSVQRGSWAETAIDKTNKAHEANRDPSKCFFMYWRTGSVLDFCGPLFDNECATEELFLPHMHYHLIGI